VNLKTGTSVPQEAPGTTLRTGQGQTLRLIPPGEFMMGSSRREQGRRSNETLHAVELIRPAYIGTREITNAEFREFQSGHNSGAVHRYTLDGDTQPAVEVSWEEAAAFCNWLSARDSLPPAYVAKGETLVPASPMSTGYRLPTEAEWVRAARYAGTGDGLKYPWGDAYPPVSGTGNYADASAAKILSDVMDSYDDGFPATAPTGSFAANALGLFDLGGNVAEWVHDYYTIYPSAGGGRLTDPAGPAEGRYHVIRGAGWMDAGISRLRLSYRDYGDDRRQDVGFRIARYAQ
jgi:formylglycine-generating enzyme required for sulfatase activity